MNYKKMTDPEISIYEWLTKVQQFSENSEKVLWKKYGVLLENLAAFNKKDSLTKNLIVIEKELNRVSLLSDNLAK